jgi:hypothetical protein
MSNKNSKHHNAPAKTETPAPAATPAAEGTNEGTQTEGNELGADLEDSAEKNLSMHIVNENTPKFGELEWLMEKNPLDFVNETVTSSKYDAKREEKIHDGITIIASITLAGTEINPLLLLLARWWEVKPARTEIKKMIDAEAIAKGFAADVYMQLELGKQVDALAEIQSAVDRIRYAKTYYKPRNRELSTAVITKPLQIDGEIYEVPVIELEKAKITFKDEPNNDKMKAHLITLSVKRTVEIESL